MNMTSNIRYKSRIPVKTGERAFSLLYVGLSLNVISAVMSPCFRLSGRRSASLHLQPPLIQSYDG